MTLTFDLLTRKLWRYFEHYKCTKSEINNYLLTIVPTYKTDKPVAKQSGHDGPRRRNVGAYDNDDDDDDDDDDDV